MPYTACVSSTYSTVLSRYVTYENYNKMYKSQTHGDKLQTHTQIVYPYTGADWHFKPTLAKSADQPHQQRRNWQLGGPQH